MTIPLIPADKANHFVYGAIAALAASMLIGPLSGLAAALVAGIAKEVVDHLANRRSASVQKPHSVSLADAVATFAGGLVVYLSHFNVTMLIPGAGHV